MFQDRMATAEMAYYKAMGIDPPNSTTTQVGHSHDLECLQDVKRCFCVQVSNDGLQFQAGRKKFLYSPCFLLLVI